VGKLCCSELHRDLFCSTCSRLNGSETNTPESARYAAEQAAAQGKAVLPSGQAAFGEALAIHDENDATSGWFVPLLEDSSKILGFVELLEDLTFKRFSLFPSPPEAANWVRPSAVLDVARRAVGLSDELGVPSLSYYHSPDRIAWRVPIRRSEGWGVVFVVGADSWVEPQSEIGPSHHIEGQPLG
jgi:hypothetical protein